MNQKQILTEGSVLKSLIIFAIPVLLSLFLQAMYGAADLIIVGQFSNTYEQSAVASGSQLFNLIVMVITGLSMGITVFIGDNIGAKNFEKVSKGVQTGITIFAIVAIVITVVSVIFSDALASFLHAPKEAYQQTSDYIKICGIGTIFITGYNVIGAIFRGMGDSKTPLFTVFIACIINILGDLILVGVFDMGAKGAAIATILAQAISVIFSYIFIKRKKLPLTFQSLSNFIDKECFKKILIVGLPIGLQELLVQFSFVFVQMVVNDIGVNESAAIGVSEKVCVFLMLVSSAYMQSISAFVAQNNGASKYERSKKALMYGMKMALLSGSIMAILAFFGGDLLSKIFSNNLEVIVYSHQYLKAYAIDTILTALLFCFIGYFNGCGKTIFVMIQGIIGAFCVRIPIVFVMSQLDNTSLFLIGLATPISSMVQIILCIVAYVVYNKRIRHLF